MTAENFAPSLARVLVHEGGKVDDPHDPGGRTAYGVTQHVYDGYRHNMGESPRDVFNIADHERDDIYKLQYWDAIRGDELASGLDYAVFDGAVNSGAAQASKWLQRALGNVKVDGHIGQATLAAIGRHANIPALISAVCQARRDFLSQLSTFARYGKGWMNRVAEVEAAALALAAGTSAAAPAQNANASAKAAHDSAKPPAATAPGDITATAGGVGLVTAAILGTGKVAIEPAPPAPPTASSPPPPSPPTSGPSAPATSAPSTASTPAASTPAAPESSGATTSVTQPSKPPITIDTHHLPLLTIAFAALLLLGLFWSFSSRGARKKRADALGDTTMPTTPLGSTASVSQATAPGPAPAHTGLSLADLAARVSSAAWIAGTIAVNVVALAHLWRLLGFADADWHGPFLAAGRIYNSYAGAAYSAISTWIASQVSFTPPKWALDIFVLYVSMASAFVVGGNGLMRRDTSAQAFFGSIINAGWLLALPAFLLDAIRFHVVSRFAKQNTVLFFAYVASFVVLYIAARVVNQHFVGA